MINRSNTSTGNREDDRLVRALTAGFFGTVSATFVLAVAYWFASLIGDEASPSVLLRWFWSLANNVVTESVQTSLPLAVLLHFIAGIAWAIVYAFFAESLLSGPGWRRGSIFSLAPWLLSIVVFLPVLGGGFLGLGLGAGPLPIIGNLVVHLVYGATMGQLYLAESDRPVSERGEPESASELLALSSANRTLAFGIVVGLVLGAGLGLLAGITFAGGIGLWVALLFGALIGSALGALAGSFWGLSPQQR